MSPGSNALVVPPPFCNLSEGPFDERYEEVVAGDDRLFAIIATPRGRVPDVGVLLVHAVTTGQNRLWIRLGRDLAARGVTSLRLDLHGQGESSGIQRDRGFDGKTRRDVLAAVEVLRAQGCTRIVLVSYCWAALAVLLAADAIPDAVAAVLVRPPFEVLRAPVVLAGLDAGSRSPARKVLRTLVSPAGRQRLIADADYRAWVAARALRRITPQAARQAAGQTTFDAQDVVRRLAGLGPRRLSVAALFGTDDPGAPESDPRDRAVRDAVGSYLRVERVPGSVHGHGTLEAQEAVRDFVLRNVLATLTPSENETGPALDLP